MAVLGRVVGVAAGAFMLLAVAGAAAAAALKSQLRRVDDPEADEIALAAVFAPLYFRSTARSFRGGTIDCWYGGGTIDLREATIDPAGAQLRVRAIFGGGQIVVPETWSVTTKVRGVGGAGDARPAETRPEDGPQLTIEGTALFGGFGVTSKLREEDAAAMRKAVEQYEMRQQRRLGTQSVATETAV
jgi:hypothetical protein